MAVDKISNGVNNFSDSYNSIRKIVNGEFVDESVANRPASDVQSNVEILGGAIDVLNSESVGEWDKTTRYYLGDVVSFAGEFFKSISDDNLGHLPIVLSSREVILDEFWSPLTSAEMLLVRDTIKRDTAVLIEQDDTAVGAVSNLNKTSGISKISNGRFATKFKIDAGSSYTFVRGSMGVPFMSSYKLYFKFLAGQGSADWPEESYVEMDLVYLGFDYNSNGLIVPEVHFKNCSTKVGSYEYINRNAPSFWDRFGAYGISIQSNLELDGSVSITISSKWNCEMRIAGDYNVQPIMDKVTTTAAVKYAYQINHLVRPYGGDSAQNIGAIVSFDGSLTRRQVWDRGLLWRFRDISVTSDVYSLFMIAKGYKINFKNSRTGTTPSDLTSITPKNNERGGVASLNLLSLEDRVLRSSGSVSSQTLGTRIEDAIRNFTGEVQNTAFGNNWSLMGFTSNGNSWITDGIFKKSGVVQLKNTSQNVISYGYGLWKLKIDASDSVPTSSENRVKSHTVEMFSQTH